MKKQEIVTFKVDRNLFEIIQGMPNRSEFIRSAVLAALGSICPLCNGTGILTPNQKQHWDDFSEAHSVETCEDCRERYLVCSCAEHHHK
ncbi:MAG: CopG family transcriptional regulator [Desulfomonilia bacterium]|uniref:CopG family transcriptional regulator n=1 Tax=anaerobic digester metagenome TaxID=1263854 RepID=A0A485M4K8_9ZZZZ|nr:CopG family transcriptional regulator [Pseudomonadota bacterium]HON38246.1 CopG family transcriptional regulator [Deltaproteobacteria bacterium]HRS56095.1 CopG family transcriptional regulator [Desulfomonilia bacterium]HPD21523.1 CopG family transcriptional regulator [Deltaproteobacteria bacterium]HPX18737.1 CopG family transcriptional regulator [Deltaproteobacteria bacterium]